MNASHEHEKGAAPGPRFRTAFGFLSALKRDPLGFLMDCHHRYGDVVHVRAFPIETLILTHPSAVRTVLQDHHRNYWKGSIFTKLKRIAGEGLVFSDGELWRRQRQLVQPAFRRDRIAALAPMMVACCERMLERWEGLAAEGHPVEMTEELSLLTLEIAARALFGTDLGEDRERFRLAIEGGLGYADHLVKHFVTPPLAIPTPANLRARRAIRAIDEILWKVIAERRREGKDRGDLLSMLLASRDAETDESMDDRQLRDECTTFIVAGHETTAMALTWAEHLLSLHPESERRLHDEVVGAVGSRLPSLEDLGTLSFPRRVFEESMRLYPPVWALARQSYEDDEVGEHRVPAGTVVTLSPYLTHRHPDFWEHPEGFDPDRFRPERCLERHEFAYFPFGGGPRRCIGMQFASMEAQLVLAMIHQRFELEAVPGQRVEPHPVLTLKPRDGVWMRLRRRH
jgi:cytochrome P450